MENKRRILIAEYHTILREGLPHVVDFELQL